MAAILPFLGRFWYVPIVVGLVVAVLLMRVDLATAKADKVLADAQVTSVSKANQSLVSQLTQQKLQRTANDLAYITAQKAMVHDRVIETHTETIIEKAANDDTKVRAWVDTPLPNSVRAALASGQN
jgi:hypothetical protein